MNMFLVLGFTASGLVLFFIDFSQLVIIESRRIIKIKSIVLTVTWVIVSGILAYLEIFYSNFIPVNSLIYFFIWMFLNILYLIIKIFWEKRQL